MTAIKSDILVFFGATGDLAYKKIFPSLQVMLDRGNLNVPVIGVAKDSWTTEQLIARAKDSKQKHGVYNEAAFGMLIMAPGEELFAVPKEISGTPVEYAQEMDAYEHVLTDAMEGDATLFARQDYVEEAWRIVDPYLKLDTPAFIYDPMTWGPTEVEQKLSPDGGWHNPVEPWKNRK